jgi:beta-N-acetylhexosaminidase
MVDLSGPALTTAERQVLSNPATGGVILFTRNYESAEQIQSLIADIRSLRPELLIAVDHEGGRVQRFRNGFTRLPSAAAYRHSANSEQAAEVGGWIMASELLSIGVDFSFAPVLDLDSGVSQVIGDRAFGQDPATAARLAEAFAGGMRRAGMAAVGKHFPGHGSIAEDSHLVLPVDSRSYADIDGRDLQTFRQLIAAGIEGIMPAHVIYRQVDERPAGFSPFWIGEVLRRRLEFDGAVFSDDLSMAGASYAGDAVDRSRMALEAGCDMVLVCNAPGEVGRVLESLSGLEPDSRGSNRLDRLRGRFTVRRDELLASREWREATEVLAAIADNRVVP